MQKTQIFQIFQFWVLFRIVRFCSSSIFVQFKNKEILHVLGFWQCWNPEISSVSIYKNNWILSAFWNSNFELQNQIYVVNQNHFLKTKSKFDVLKLVCMFQILAFLQFSHSGISRKFDFLIFWSVWISKLETISFL